MARHARAVLALLPGMLVGLQAAAQTADPEASFALPKLPPLVEEQPEALLTFYFEPSAGIEYNDNVLRAVDGEERDDFLFVIAPVGRLALTGDETRGELSLGFEFGRYDEVTENDYEDIDLRARIEWTPDDRTTVRAESRARYDHNSINETAGEVENEANEITRFFEWEGKVEAERRYGLWIVGANGGLGYVDFEDFTSRDVGGPIFNGDRDRVEGHGGASLGREIDLGLVAFVEGLASRYDYVEDIEARNFDRSSSGFGALGGLRYGERSDDLFAEIGLGVLHRDYDADGLDDIVMPGLRSEVLYRTLERKLRLRGRARTEIHDTDLTGASGYKGARIDLDASYDVAEAITLFASTDLQWRNFVVDDSAENREDFIATFDAGARYFVLPPGFVELKLRYRERTSDDPEAEFDAVSASISVGAAF